ncbi:MAG: M23 family metallopeptidase [Myxococcota bacterium]|nr:M23 family metallopeptidase [Myxococcota bacterium]
MRFIQHQIQPFSLTILFHLCLCSTGGLLGCTISTEHVLETDPFDTSRRALAQRVFRRTLVNLRARINSSPQDDKTLRNLFTELKHLQRTQSDAGSIHLNQQIEELVVIAQQRLGPNHRPKAQQRDVRPPSFHMPIVQGRISSTFGMRQDPFDSAKVVFHNGVDFVAEPGTPVLASADGRIIQAGFRTDGCGLAVSILHADDFVSDYCHLSRINVEMLSAVQKGMEVGRVGSTGRASGPHLHWVIWHRGVAVDPILMADGKVQ